MASVVLDRVEHRYAGGHAAVRGVDLQIADGEFMVLVGPSGCGKSTLLRLIAGLETPSAGRILVDGHDVTAVPPQGRDVAMVFQSYALYPHMTIRENLAYGLRVRGMERAAIASKVEAIAEALGVRALLDRRPAQLSGGQRQRVALGRAMVREPKVFLLDEPLSNLDPALRTQARAELLQLHRRLAATLVYVTHDQEEAMTLGTRVAVMRDGIIEQTGPPMELYTRPANTFVARFTGMPPMNLIAAPLPTVNAPAGTTIGIRPHDVRLGAGGTELTAVVEVVEPRGHDSLVHLTVQRSGARASVVAVVAGTTPSPGTVVGMVMPEDRLHFFGSDGRRLPD